MGVGFVPDFEPFRPHVRHVQPGDCIDQMGRAAFGAYVRLQEQVASLRLLA